MTSSRASGKSSNGQSDPFPPDGRSERPRPRAIRGHSGSCNVLRVLAAAFLVAAAAPQPVSHPIWTDWTPIRSPGRFALPGGTILMQQVLGTSKVDWLTGLIQTQDGGIVGVGYINRDDEGSAAWDAVVVKFAPDGRLKWARQLKGGALDSIWSVEEDPSGRIMLAGFTSSRGAGHWDGYFAGLSPEGVTVFERSFGGDKEDRLVDFVRTPDGGYLLVGQTSSRGAGERDVYLVKADRMGVLQWERTYGGPGMDRGFGIAATPGGYVIAGVTSGRSIDGLVMKVDESGRTLWRRTLEGQADDIPHAINALPDGKVVVTGYTQSWGASDHDFFAATYTPAGQLLRHELFGGDGDDRAMASATDVDGGTLVIGYSRSCGRPDYDILVAGISPDGAFQEAAFCVGAAGEDYGNAVLPLADGLLLGGYTESFGAGAADAFVIRMERPPPRPLAGFASRRISDPSASYPAADGGKR